MEKFDSTCEKSEPSGGLLSMLKEGHLCDLIVTVGGNRPDQAAREFLVHKVVVASGSKHLLDLLKAKGRGPTNLEFPDEQPQLFAQLVSFCYGVKPTLGRAVEGARLYAIAERFGCQDIKEFAIGDIKKRISRSQDGEPLEDVAEAFGILFGVYKKKDDQLYENLLQEMRLEACPTKVFEFKAVMEPVVANAELARMVITWLAI